MSCAQVTETVICRVGTSNLPVLDSELHRHPRLSFLNLHTVYELTPALCLVEDITSLLFLLLPTRCFL